ncbi:hypothetical protein BBOMB_1492 [Bifidobacterium bombi DSM 19703]|uniref:Uncharacterized protein n=1 Tax=Bifidobacterium bombi DSM 19703 TaxID=1341695 RepID=A0A086BNW2_9BIFI|nr:hypothetical protein BBOMB_1492 [Bifidobacterium bombi DSM 19703]
MINQVLMQCATGCILVASVLAFSNVSPKRRDTNKGASLAGAFFAFLGAPIDSSQPDN